jgi:hypothetical protein
MSSELLLIKTLLIAIRDVNLLLVELVGFDGQACFLGHLCKMFTELTQKGNAPSKGTYSL